MSSTGNLAKKKSVVINTQPNASFVIVRDKSGGLNSGTNGQRNIQTDNIMSYIADLKKVAGSNKNKRSSSNINSSGPSTNIRKTKQNKSGQIQNIYNYGAQVSMPKSNNFFRNQGFGLSSDDDALKHAFSPQADSNSYVQYLTSGDEQFPTSTEAKRQTPTSQSKFANKAYQVLAQKRVTSMLKSTRDNLQDIANNTSSTTKSQPTSVMAMAANRSFSKPPGGTNISEIQPHNLTSYGNLFKNGTPSKKQLIAARGVSESVQNMNIQNYAQTSFTPTSAVAPSSKTGRRKVMEEIAAQAMRKPKNQNSIKRSDRQEKDVIIRKNSSKSFLKAPLGAFAVPSDNMIQASMNNTQVLPSGIGQSNVISNEFILIQNQVITDLNKTQQIIAPAPVMDDARYQEELANKRMLDKKKILAQGKSGSSNISKDQIKRIVQGGLAPQNIKTTYGYQQVDPIVTDSTEMTDLRFRGTYAENYTNETGEESQHKRHLSSGPNIPLYNSRKYNHSIGNNSIGKKTLNLSHQYNDSSIYELNFSQGKIGTGGLNLTSLIKSNLLEDEGLEDLHFHSVAFSHHKEKLLHKMEHKEMMEQLKKDMYDRGEIDCISDIKKAKTHQIQAEVEVEKIKTIESVDEIELF